MAAGGGHISELVQSKLDEFFWEWLSLPESNKIILQAIQYAKGDGLRDGLRDSSAASPGFVPRGSPSGRSAPSPPGSPHSRPAARDLASYSESGPGSPSGATSGTLTPPAKFDLEPAEKSSLSESEPRSLPAPGTAKVIPRFWWPKKSRPAEKLPDDFRSKLHEEFEKQAISKIETSKELEPIVTEVFGLSRYCAAPILWKIKVFFGMVDHSTGKEALLEPCKKPLTEDMVAKWAAGRIQPDDPVLSFFWLAKKDHNNWIEREDFSIFLQAVLLLHPGLDFLRETNEFQERYADTVISRIFFVHDTKDIGRIYLHSMRRIRPSIIDTWKQLAEFDDIKMVRDYFSYEHFYVIYCTFWELDSDHDFLLDKDDLLKYDGHTLSRRAVDRIFSEIPSKFTSGVPGKMGYDDFIRFLLCDQNRQTDRSVEYWFNLFDLDGDGMIRLHEMKYFYEEQVQRMECLNYDAIMFQDMMCQMNDMIWPKSEGRFALSDFKRRRKVAGTFFAFLSSLNRLLNFEHRDPFQTRQELLENPTYSDWDRWCANEYVRLAMEESGDPEEETNNMTDGGAD